MVNRTLLAQKLGELADRIARVREHTASNASHLHDNRDAFELVSFNLMLAVQVCADIASHIIADESWPPASSLGDSFLRLEQHGVISAANANALRQAVGLRNIVAHGYGSIDYDRVEYAATAGIDDLSQFAQAVAGWAEQSEPTTD